MVVDAVVEAARVRRRSHSRVRRLRRVGDLLVGDELRGLGEIEQRLVELAHRDVAVPAKTQEAHVLGIPRDAAGECGDGLAEAPERRKAAAQPQDVFRGIGIGHVRGGGRGELLVERLLLLRRDLGRR